MTEKRCAECRHWLINEPELDGKRPCSLISASIGSAAENKGELAITTASWDYESELYTRSDFGCVLFEPKEKA